jgi:hypothetical protein
MWNARFLASAGGSNRSYFYEEHAIRMANVVSPNRELFLNSDGIRTIDLLTRIY